MGMFWKGGKFADQLGMMGVLVLYQVWEGAVCTVECIRQTCQIYQTLKRLGVKADYLKKIIIILAEKKELNI